MSKPVHVGVMLPKGKYDAARKMFRGLFEATLPCGCKISVGSLPRTNKKCKHGNYFIRYV